MNKILKTFALVVAAFTFVACNGVFGPTWKERAGVYRASSTNFFELKVDGTIVISTNTKYPLSIKNYNPDYRALAASATMELPLQLGSGNILFNFVSDTSCLVTIEKNFKGTTTTFLKEE